MVMLLLIVVRRRRERVGYMLGWRHQAVGMLSGAGEK
jgi:hypothetical protein